MKKPGFQKSRAAGWNGDRSDVAVIGSDVGVDLDDQMR
jgi:hypothetical protein